MNLEQTLERAVADNSAFKEIYDLTINRVYSYVLLRTKNKNETLDICQEIYLSFWQSLPGFTFISEPHFYGFLFTVARRKLIKARIKNKETVSLDEVFDIPGEAENHEDYRLLLKTLQNLKERERICLELRYFEDLKFSDIADTLGIKENHAKVLHHRAIKKLEKMLKHE